MLNFELKKYIANLGPESLHGLYFTKEEGDLMGGAGAGSSLGRQKGTGACLRSSRRKVSCSLCQRVAEMDGLVHGLCTKILRENGATGVAKTEHVATLSREEEDGAGGRLDRQEPRCFASSCHHLEQNINGLGTFAYEPLRPPDFTDITPLSTLCELMCLTEAIEGMICRVTCN